jgi:hypothetical protein
MVVPLPNLTPSLGRNFQQVAALFAKAQQPSLTVSPPVTVVPPVIDSSLAATPYGASPIVNSPQLSSLWAESISLYSFLLTTHSSFSTIPASAPTFPVSSVGDDAFVAGSYYVSVRGIFKYDFPAKHWEPIFSQFLPEDSEDVPFIHSSPHYFRLT